MRLVIQNNLIRSKDVHEILEICEALGIEAEGVMVIPFSEELPEFQLHDSNFYYGSTTFIKNVYEQLNPRGVFFDPDVFTSETILREWNPWILGREGEVTAISEFASRNLEGTRWFIRPNNDDKSFTGSVMEFEQIQEWTERFQRYDNVELNGDTKVFVCPPRDIVKEWRNFVVGGKVVVSSRFREFRILRVSGTDIPEEMLAVANEAIAHYQPDEMFVMDILPLRTIYFLHLFY